LNPIYVSKTLVAASSNLVGAVSTAATSVVTVNSSNMPLDTQRRIVFTSTAADTSSLTLTFTGTRQGGGTVVESVKGSTAGAGTNATTTSDFLTVTSIGISSNANVPVLVGTSSVGGTPWQSVSVNISPPVIGAGLTFVSTAASNGSMSAQIDITMDNPFGPYGQIRGPGGLSAPINPVPTIFQSTHWQSITANNWDAINIQINPGGYVPISAWRLTITSSSSQAGSVNVTAIQAGLGD
jgi:hypothetical protein